MSESSMGTPSGQDREGAAAAMADLPGETALGHVDPRTVREHPGDVADVQDAAASAGFTEDARSRRDGDPGGTSSEYAATLPQDEIGGVRPLAELDRSDTSLGDLSTGGEAAREALGIDPASAGEGEVEDRTTG